MNEYHIITNKITYEDLSTTRIKFTSITSINDKIIMGANTGSLYLSSIPGELTMISLQELDSEITCMTSFNKLIAIGTREGGVFIYKNLKKLILKIPDSKLVTNIKFCGEEYLITGSSKGVINFILIKQKKINKIKLDSSIVQIDTNNPFVLISTITKSIIFNLLNFENLKVEESQGIQIGTKLRSGYFGACFHPSRQNFVISSRPGSRLWIVDSRNGKVLKTLNLKKTVGKQFGKLWLLKNGLLISNSSEEYSKYLILNLSSLELVYKLPKTNIREVINDKVYEISKINNHEIIETLIFNCEEYFKYLINPIEEFKLKNFSKVIKYFKYGDYKELKFLKEINPTFTFSKEFEDFFLILKKKKIEKEEIKLEKERKKIEKEKKLEEEIRKKLEKEEEKKLKEEEKRKEEKILKIEFKKIEKEKKKLEKERLKKEIEIKKQEIKKKKIEKKLKKEKLRLEKEFERKRLEEERIKKELIEKERLEQERIKLEEERKKLEEEERIKKLKEEERIRKQEIERKKHEEYLIKLNNEVEEFEIENEINESWINRFNNYVTKIGELGRFIPESIQIKLAKYGENFKTDFELIKFIKKYPIDPKLIVYYCSKWDSVLEELKTIVPELRNLPISDSEEIFESIKGGREFLAYFISDILYKINKKKARKIFLNLNPEFVIRKFPNDLNLWEMLFNKGLTNINLISKYFSLLLKNPLKNKKMIKKVSLILPNSLELMTKAKWYEGIFELFCNQKKILEAINLICTLGLINLLDNFINNFMENPTSKNDWIPFLYPSNILPEDLIKRMLIHLSPNDVLDLLELHPLPKLKFSTFLLISQDIKKWSLQQKWANKIIEKTSEISWTLKPNFIPKELENMINSEIQGDFKSSEPPPLTILNNRNHWGVHLNNKFCFFCGESIEKCPTIIYRCGHTYHNKCDQDFCCVCLKK